MIRIQRFLFVSYLVTLAFMLLLVLFVKPAKAQGGGCHPLPGQVCCPPGQVFSTDVIGCIQKDCPSGIGRNDSDQCKCPDGVQTQYSDNVDPTSGAHYQLVSGCGDQNAGSSSSMSGDSSAPQLGVPSNGSQAPAPPKSWWQQQSSTTKGVIVVGGIGAGLLGLWVLAGWLGIFGGGAAAATAAAAGVAEAEAEILMTSWIEGKMARATGRFTLNKIVGAIRNHFAEKLATMTARQQTAFITEELLGVLNKALVALGKKEMSSQGLSAFLSFLDFVI